MSATVCILTLVMGRSRAHKRKKSMESSDQSSVHEEAPAFSQLLSEANNVLYENKTDCNDKSSNLPITSTPINKPIGASVDLKLDYIMKKLDVLDNIVEVISRLDGRALQIERRIEIIEKKSIDFEKTVVFVSNKVDEFDKKCSDMSIEVSNQLKTFKMGQQKALDKVKEDLEKHRVNNDSEQLKELKNTVLDLKCRSMKNNLVFTGLGGETNTEDTEGKLRDFIYHELEIEKDLEFDNVHRFGRFVRGKDRPVVARFLYHGDRLLVLKSAYKLQGKPFGIHEQFPKEVEDKRRQLYPIQRRCRQAGQRTKLVRDKLYVDGKLYEFEEGSVGSGRTHGSYSDAARSAHHTNGERAGAAGPRSGPNTREMNQTSARGGPV